MYIKCKLAYLTTIFDYDILYYYNRRCNFIMLIEKGSSFLMLKIKTPLEIDFFNEHKYLIDTYGYAWFCRFGRSNLLISSINKYGNIIFVKESIARGNNIYMLEFDKISESPENGNYPPYYNQTEQKKALWFRIINITQVPNEIIMDSFVSTSSYSDLTRTFRSMCSAFYISATTNISL